MNAGWLCCPRWQYGKARRNFISNVKNIETKIQCSRRKVHEAYMACHHVLLPTLKYTLGTILDCKKIMGPTWLCCLGLTRFIANKLVHDIVYYGAPEKARRWHYLSKNVPWLPDEGR